MNFNRRFIGVMALVGALTALMLTAQLSSATHPRPKGASPLRVPLVPAYKQCTVPNSTHGAPLAFPSCNPPVQASNFLTIGSPDANGAGANSTAFVLLTVIVGAPGPPDDSDVKIDSVGTDVRCKPATAAAVCNSANAADGPDYSGQLQGNATIRISDHYNGTSATDAATVSDIPFPVNATCANTASTAVGADCITHTSANATVPGSVKDAKRAVVEIGQIQISDGGADGQVSTADNTLFSVQGIFIP